MKIDGKTKIRREFMDIIGLISVDELTTNKKVTEIIRGIYEELSQ